MFGHKPPENQSISSRSSFNNLPMLSDNTEMALFTLTHLCDPARNVTSESVFDSAAFNEAALTNSSSSVAMNEYAFFPPDTGTHSQGKNKRNRLLAELETSYDHPHRAAIRDLDKQIANLNNLGEQEALLQYRNLLENPLLDEHQGKKTKLLKKYMTILCHHVQWYLTPYILKKVAVLPKEKQTDFIYLLREGSTMKYSYFCTNIQGEAISGNLTVADASEINTCDKVVALISTSNNKKYDISDQARCTEAKKVFLDIERFRDLTATLGTELTTKIAALSTKIAALQLETAQPTPFSNGIRP